MECYSINEPPLAVEYVINFVRPMKTRDERKSRGCATGRRNVGKESGAGGAATLAGLVSANGALVNFPLVRPTSVAAADRFGETRKPSPTHARTARRSLVRAAAPESSLAEQRSAGQPPSPQTQKENKPPSRIWPTPRRTAGVAFPATPRKPVPKPFRLADPSPGCCRSFFSPSLFYTPF